MPVGADFAHHLQDAAGRHFDEQGLARPLGQQAGFQGALSWVVITGIADPALPPPPRGFFRRLRLPSGLPSTTRHRGSARGATATSF